MSLYEYASKTGISIDSLLELCLILEIDIDDENDILSNTDLDLLEQKIMDNDLNDDTQYNASGGGDIDIEPSDLYYGLKAVETLIDDLRSLGSTFGGLNFGEGVVLNLSPLTSLIGGGGNNALVVEVEEVRDSIKRTKQNFEEQSAEIALLFNYLDGEFIDEESGFADAIEMENYIQKNNLEGDFANQLLGSIDDYNLNVFYNKVLSSRDYISENGKFDTNKISKDLKELGLSDTQGIIDKISWSNSFADGFSNNGRFYNKDGSLNQEKINQFKVFYKDKYGTEFVDIYGSEQNAKNYIDNYNKIMSDPEQATAYLQESYAKQYGYNSFSDMLNLENELTTKINNNLNSINKLQFSDAKVTDAFIQMIMTKYNGICPNISVLAANEFIAYSYTDSNGNEVMTYSLDNIPKGDFTVNALTYKDLCEDSSYYRSLVDNNTKKNFFGMPKVVNEVYAQVRDEINKDSSEIYKINEELKNFVSQRKEVNGLVSSIALSAKETAFLSQYITKDDFSTNSLNLSSDAVRDVIKDIKKSGGSGFVAFINDAVGYSLGNNENYQYVDSKQSKAIINSLISGDNEFTVIGDQISYVDDFGKTVYIKSTDPNLSNFALWANEMSDDEKACFNYVWNTSGDVDQYLKNISNALDTRYVYNRIKEDEAFAKEHEHLASLASVVLNPCEGLNAWAYSTNQMLTGQEMYSSHIYSHGDTMRSTVSQGIDSDVKRFFYDGTMSILDNAMSIAMTGGVPVASGIMLGMGSFDNSLNDAKSRGLTDKQAYLYSSSMAAVEALTEAISVDNLVHLEKIGGNLFKVSDDVIEGLAKQTKQLDWYENSVDAMFKNQILPKVVDIKNPVAQRLAYSFTNSLYGTVKQGPGEALEEVISSLAGRPIDYVIAGDKSSFNLSIENYMKMGYTEEMAYSMAKQDFANEVILSGLSGLYSGSVSGGGKLGASSLFTSNFNNQLNFNMMLGNYDAVIDQVMSYDKVDLEKRILSANNIIDSLLVSETIDETGRQELLDIVKKYNTAEVKVEESVSEGLTTETATTVSEAKNVETVDPIESTTSVDGESVVADSDGMISETSKSGIETMSGGDTKVSNGDIQTTQIANEAGVSEEISVSDTSSGDNKEISLGQTTGNVNIDNKTNISVETNSETGNTSNDKQLGGTSMMASTIGGGLTAMQSANGINNGNLSMSNASNTGSSSDSSSNGKSKTDISSNGDKIIEHSSDRGNISTESTTSYKSKTAFLDYNLSIENIRAMINNLDYGKMSIPEYIVSYMKSNFRKFQYRSTNTFKGLNEQIMKNGLYHFTDKVDAIIKSGYIKPSGYNASYGNKKSFFFNGIPDVGAFATNLDSIPIKTTAIKVNPTSDVVNNSKLKLRYTDDMALSWDGKFSLKNVTVDKCYFVLSIENNRLVYMPVSEQVYNNYENTNMAKVLSDYVSNKSNITMIKGNFLTEISVRNQSAGLSTMDEMINNVSNIIDPVYGFQLNSSSFGPWYKARIASGFFDQVQIQSMLQKINNTGYISESSGRYFSSLFDDDGYDIYVKTVYSGDVESIMSEGVRCLGTSTSGYGISPKSISDIRLNNTVTKIDGVYELFRTLKGAFGISQGGNSINGTLILKVPKGANVSDIVYFSEKSNTYCINPEYIDSFSQVEQNGVVSEPVFNDIVIDEVFNFDESSQLTLNVSENLEQVLSTDSQSAVKSENQSQDVKIVNEHKEYSYYSLEKINDDCKNYQELCNLFISLTDDVETKNKLEEILYFGGYNGYSLNTDRSSRDNPFIEMQRRISMAELLIKNPNTFNVIVKNNVNLFHGTNSNALVGILKYGLNNFDYLKNNSISVSTGERWSRSSGRGFTSLTDVLGVAEGYSTINPGESTFEVIIGTTVDEAKKGKIIRVGSDIPEVAIKGSLPVESIKVILVPSAKVNFVKEMVSNTNIEVLPLDYNEHEFYSLDTFSEELKINYDKFNEFKGSSVTQIDDSSWVESEDLGIEEEDYELGEGESLRDRIGLQFFGGKSEGNVNNLQIVMDNLLSGIKAMDNKYGNGIGIKSMYEYIKTGNPKLLSSAGNLRSIAVSMDRDTLIECYNAIVNERGIAVNSVENVNSSTVDFSPVEYMKSVSKVQIGKNLKSIVSTFMDGVWESCGNLYDVLVKINSPVKGVPDKINYDAFVKRFPDEKYIAFGHYFYEVMSSGFTSSDVNHRLYINGEFNDVYKFLELFADECEKNKIPFRFKTPRMDFNSSLVADSLALERSESAVIYASDKYISEYIKICQKLKEQNPEFRFYSPSVVAASIDGWLGYGMEPSALVHDKLKSEGIREVSFHTVRAHILDLSLDRGINDFIIKYGNGIISGNYTVNDACINAIYSLIVKKSNITDGNGLYGYLSSNKDSFIKVLMRGESIRLNGISVSTREVKSFLYKNYLKENSQLYNCIENAISEISLYYEVDPNNFSLNIQEGNLSNNIVDKKSVNLNNNSSVELKEGQSLREKKVALSNDLKPSENLTGETKTDVGFRIVGNLDGVDYSLNDLRIPIHSIDSQYGIGTAINQLYNYLINDDINVITDIKLRYVVMNMDRDMLLKSYEKLVNEYNNQMKKTNKETNVLKNEILSNMPSDLDDLDKCRYLYLELNKRVSYEQGYFALKSNSETKNAYYNQSVSFASLVGNKVICNGWSQLYRELLISAGINPERISIAGTNAIGAHKWVEISFGNYFIRADATDAFNHSIDLSASKSGSSTNGFIALSNEYSGINLNRRPDGSDKTYFQRLVQEGLIDNQWLRQLDISLGYVESSIGKYFNELVSDLAKDFYKPKLVEQTFGVKNDNLIVAKHNFYKNLEIPDNMNAYDAYAYLNQTKYAVFGGGYKDLSVTLYYKQSLNSSIPVGAVSIIDTSGGVGNIYVKIIDDELGIIEYKVNNLHECDNLIKSLGYYVI